MIVNKQFNFLNSIGKLLKNLRWIDIERASLAWIWARSTTSVFSEEHAYFA